MLDVGVGTKLFSKKVSPNSDTYTSFYVLTEQERDNYTKTKQFTGIRVHRSELQITELQQKVAREKKAPKGLRRKNTPKWPNKTAVITEASKIACIRPFPLLTMKRQRIKHTRKKDRQLLGDHFEETF